MVTNPATSVASARLVMLQSCLLLGVALVPWPEKLGFPALGDRLGTVSQAQSGRATRCTPQATMKG